MPKFRQFSCNFLLNLNMISAGRRFELDSSRLEMAKNCSTKLHTVLYLPVPRWIVQPWDYGHFFTVWNLNKLTFTLSKEMKILKNVVLQMHFNFEFHEIFEKTNWNSLNREKLSKHPCWLKSGVFSRIFP